MISRKDILEKELKKWLSGAKRVVVAGIGNPIRMDDFVGVKIIHDLQGKVSDNIFLLDCETVPESYLKQIDNFRPTHVLLIDAAITGLKPGKSKLIKPEELKDFPAISTHMLPLKIFCQYIINTTRATISLILIEPEKTDFGEGLTAEVEAAAQEIEHILLKVLPCIKSKIPL